MYTFSFFGRVLALSMLIMPSAFAQNLVVNPQFDHDAANWTLSDSVQWDSFGLDQGSVHLMSETSMSNATQCVAAEGGWAFVAIAHVYGHCPGARLYAIWAA